MEHSTIYDWNTHEAPHTMGRDKVTLDDETLRDGLQSPSVYDPDIDRKIELLHLMNRLGIYTAALGLPGAGPRAVADVTRLAQAIDQDGLKIRANCAARTVVTDIAPIADIVQKTGVPIEAATFIGSSEIRQITEDWDMERMLKSTRDAVSWGVGHGLEIMYVTEDTTRAQPETIRTLYRAALDCGATRLVFCDTVGHATPQGVKALMRFARNLIEEAGQPEVKLDFHGHNDRGLGVINALAAIEAGADQVHGCALGIGERSGNSAMDQLIVNMYLLGWITEQDMDLKAIPDYVHKVSEYCRVAIPHNYPVVGPDAFETGTGVHAAAVIKALRKGDTALANRVYSGVPADVFGMSQSIRIGPMSGRSNVIWWLESHGHEAEDTLVDRIFEAAKTSQRLLTDDEVQRLIDGSTPINEWETPPGH